MLDVFQSHHVAAREGSSRTGTKDQVLHRARACTPTDERLEPIGRGAAGWPCSANQLGSVLINMVGNRHPTDEILKSDDLRSVEQMRKLGQLVAGGGTSDFDFLIFRWVIELDQEHKA